MVICLPYWAMNSLIILPEECVDASCAVLSGARAAYAYETHGLRAGQRVKAAVLGGLRGEALARESALGRVVLELSLSIPAREPRPFDLIVGVSRPQTIKKCVQAAVMLGVRSLHFVRSEKGDKSYLQSTALLEENLREESIKALEQVWDSRPPQIVVHKSFRHFCENKIAPLVAAPEVAKIVAHPCGEGLHAALEVSSHGADSRRSGAVVAIGPERGWSEAELALLQALGFRVVDLGERVLRVEIAITFLLGQLEALSS